MRLEIATKAFSWLDIRSEYSTLLQYIFLQSRVWHALFSLSLLRYIAYIAHLIIMGVDLIFLVLMMVYRRHGSPNNHGCWPRYWQIFLENMSCSGSSNGEQHTSAVELWFLCFLRTKDMNLMEVFKRLQASKILNYWAAERIHELTLNSPDPSDFMYGQQTLKVAIVKLLMFCWHIHCK